ncbi:hypothetical protein HY745_11930, partial [Candidatus Desantisbacteria bacterium]|nr:hypothetical protein [Candidatus Desantisbacteria bacterium]
FDGQAVVTNGDRLVVAASNTSQTWGVNDGNVSMISTTNPHQYFPFSHSRVYPVTAGNNTFYAVAHNYVETAGTGLVAIYGILTVEFFPN